MASNFRLGDGFQEELNGLPYEGTVTPPGLGSIDTTFAFTAPASGTREGKGSIDTTFAFSAPAAGVGSGPKFGAIDTTFAFTAPATGVGSGERFGSIDTTFAFTATASGGVLPEFGSIDTTFAFTAPATSTSNAFHFVSSSSLFPERIGVTVGSDPTSTHAVITGVTSKTVGTNPVLTGDYAFRGLYSFDTTTTIPGNSSIDGRDWVTLASWGDFTFRFRRQAADGYQIRADFVTAAAAPNSATGTLIIPSNSPLSIGLGVTRDATTGVVKLWKSLDGWVTWTQIPTASHVDAPGALPDSVPSPITLLGGDLRDGPWISIYQAQWGATSNINAVDAAEVTAWNYGPNIVTGVGGDFYDTFDKAAKDTWEFGSESSYAYSQRSETTTAGTTARVDYTFNADTLATGTAPVGTTAAFTRDPTPLWENGPGKMMLSPPILFSGSSQFSLNDFTGNASDHTADGTPRPYRVVLCDKEGVEQQVLENAIVGEMTWSLNESETFSFSMPLHDPLTAGIHPVQQEVQVWRGGELLIWGVIVRPALSGALVTYQCKGLMWYFTKRFVGGPRQSFIYNGSFETNDGWFFNQFAPSELEENRDPAFWSSEITSEQSLTGFPGRSLKLSSNGTMEFGIEAYQYFLHEIDSEDRPDGILWTAAAWVYIPSEEWGEYDDEADDVIGERNAAYNWGGESAAHGLHLLRLNPDKFDEEAAAIGLTVPEVHEIAVASLSEELERDQWVRIEVSLTQPAPENGGVRTDHIQVALHAPIGTVYWDEVSLTRNERLFYNDVPQEAIMFSLVQHAQDPAFGKSDLNIGFAAVPITEINRTRTYDFFNRELISDLLDDFSTLWDGCDWSIESYATGYRLFHPWHPMKGTRRPALPLVLGENISKVGWANDGEAIATRVAVMSDSGGTGSSRNEVMGTNLSGFADGLIIEEAINAAKESPLDSLDGQLEQALRSRRNGKIPVLTTYESPEWQMIGKLHTGDIVTCDCDYGGISIQGEHRIVQITLDPVTDQLEIALNPIHDQNDPMFPRTIRMGGNLG